VCAYIHIYDCIETVMTTRPKMARGKISSARGIHCCLSFSFISFSRQASLHCGAHVYAYVHISDCVETVHELLLLPNGRTFLYKSGEA
jgi:hypothetical protein